MAKSKAPASACPFAAGSWRNTAGKSPRAITPKVERHSNSRCRGRVRHEGIMVTPLTVSIRVTYSSREGQREKRTTLLPLPFLKGEGRGEGSLRGRTRV